MRSMALAAGLATVVLAAVAGEGATPLNVAGSPTYDEATGNGYKGGAVRVSPGCGVNNYGTAVGFATNYFSNVDRDYRAIRWDASGTAFEMGNLGTGNGWYGGFAFAINDSGIAVGSYAKMVSYFPMGMRAVRWDSSGTVATELGNLGTEVSGNTNSYAYAVNAAGTAVGFCMAYPSNVYMGDRAVRWDSSGTAVTELGSLGTDEQGRDCSYAYAVNDAGTAVGHSRKRVSTWDKGFRAVRWSASGTAATELDNLGTDTYGQSDACAWAINNAGTAVGECKKFDSYDSSYMGYRAVRWNASGTAATELGNLGTDINGFAMCRAYAINDAGTAVGRCDKAISHNLNGNRAVRWDASGTAATELGNLGVHFNGYSEAAAYAINNAGAAVGYCEKFVAGVSVGNRAVAWPADATAATDLNDLGVVSAPAGGKWTLTSAKAISADGWVSGEGSFDPDGAGPLAAYTRLWVGRVGLGGSWLNTTGVNNTWGKGANWSTGTPAIQRDARFDRNATYTVSFDANQAATSAHVTAGNVTFALGGHSLSLADGLSISSGARLVATGSISGVVSNAGVLALGNNPGTLSIDGDLASTGTVEFGIRGAAAGQFDRLLVDGQVIFGGRVNVTLGYMPSLGDSFDLMDWNNFVNSGYIFDMSQAQLPSGLTWDTSAFGDAGMISVVPEPATLSLLALGGLMLIRRKKL